MQHGKIKSLDGSKLVVEVEGVDTEYTVDRQAVKVTILGKDGVRADLKPGMAVQLHGPPKADLHCVSVLDTRTADSGPVNAGKVVPKGIEQYSAGYSEVPSKLISQDEVTAKTEKTEPLPPGVKRDAETKLPETSV